MKVSQQEAVVTKIQIETGQECERVTERITALTASKLRLKSADRVQSLFRSLGSQTRDPQR
jgi:molybdopterin-binding protein